ncbi:MAG: Coenzyme F420 hydrogenase/dehydrogenase, beta subunit C-terminal domain [Promethearchaeia archaeon]
MVQKIEKDVFSDFSSKELMDATYWAAQNFQIRGFYEAKEDILKCGKFSEEQFFEIFDTMVDAETERKIILARLRKFNDLLSLNQIVDRFPEFPREQVIRNVIYLKEQGFIEEIEEIKTKKIMKKVKGEEKEIESKQYFYKYQPKSLSDDHYEHYFTPVSLIYEAGVCSNCGWCSSICPVDAVKMDPETLEIDDDLCIKCGLCYSVCPRSFSIDRVYENIAHLDSAITFSEKVGAYLNMYSGTTSKKQIKEVRQDGGIVTSLFAYLLEEDLVDAIIAVQHSNDPWRPEPVIVETISNLYKTAGTKYANAPVLSIIDAAQEYERIAIVGVPCMVKALYKGALYPMGSPFFKNIKYIIGLFCMESFSYAAIVDLIQEKFDQDISQLTKMNIDKGKFIINLQSGEQMTVPLKEINSYARDQCHFCEDLTSEYADISVGSIGSPGGRSTVITRTENGEDIYQGAISKGYIDSKPIDKVKPGQFLVEKIAGIKRKKCKTINLTKN